VTSGEVPTASGPAASGQTEEFAHPTLGYKLRVPAAWSRRCLPDNQTCRFNALSGADRTIPARINSTNNLFVYVHPAGGKDALALAREEDRKWSSDPKFKEYRTIRLAAASMGQFQEGSLLEFTYENELTGPRHVLIFRTVVADMSYEVSLNAPADTFDKDRPVFDDAVDSFEITAS
jgi:hypothetical protein